MATVSSRGSGTPTTSGTTWATVTNAVDGAVGTNPATYATWTNATSGATGYIEISGHNFAASIGATDTINSVNVSIRTLVSNTGRISAVSFRPYDGATPIDVVSGGTVTTSAHNNAYNFIVTAAQLRSANFRIRITFTHAANTQSGVASVDYADVTVDYTPPQPSITQAAYQFFDDAGTESGATALAAQNTATTGNLTNGDGSGSLRIRLQSTTAISGSPLDDYQLQWEKNASGSWTNVGTGAVLGYGSPTLTDGAVTTNRLTGGTGTFTGGVVSEDGLADNVQVFANGYTELLFSVGLIAAQLADGDTLRFRVLYNGATTQMTYTQTPTVNIVNLVPQTWTGSIAKIGVEGVSWGMIHTPPFTPVKLHTWWDAADTVTVLHTGGVVSQWRDKAGSDNHLNPRYGTPAITGTRTINGLNALDFEAGDDMASSGYRYQLNTQPITVVIVLKADDPNTWAAIHATSASTLMMFMDPGPGSGWGIGGGHPPYVTGTKLDNVPHVIIGRWDGTATQMWIDGVPQSIGTTGYPALGYGYLVIGGLDGLIGEVLDYDRALTDPERQEIEQYILTKWFTPPDRSRVEESGFTRTTEDGVSRLVEEVPVVPPQTWTGGSTATIGVAGMSGAFVPGVVTWGGAVPVLTSLWAHDAPLGVDPGSGDTDPSGVVLGTRVRFAEAGKVNGVWFQKGNTATLTHTVTLWRQDGPGVEHAVMVASKTAALVTTGWQFIAFDAPIDVGPLADISGDQMSYVVACHYPQDPAGGDQQLNYRSIASGFASDPLVNGSLTAPQGDTNTNSGRNGRFIYTSTGASYPDNSFNFGNYLIDVEFGVLSGVASDVATIGVSGISGAFTGAAPPQTWAGSTATAGVAALSGLLIGGAITWAGGATALVGVTGVSSALLAGTVIWDGSIATVGTAGISGEFSTPPPPQSWGGAPLPTLPVVTGLQVWLDASVLTAGDLTAWPNPGDGADPAIVGSPAPQVMPNTLNGMPVVRFTFQAGRIRGTSTVTTDLTISYVVRRWGPNVGRCLTATYPGSASYNYLVGYHTSSADWFYDNGAPYGATGWVGDQMNHPTAWRLYGSDGTTTPSYVSRFFIDGVKTGVDWTAGQGMGGTYNLSGYSIDGVEETGDFEVAELVMYDRKLSDVERGQVEDYLRTKWFEPLELADTAILGITGVTGEFSTFAPPQTWVGSIATVGVAGITGVFIGGPITWVSSSISTVGAAGISAAFVPGAIAWAGSIATSGAAGITGALVPGTAPWAGSIATSGVSGVSGAFVPGAITWVSTSIATAGVAALTGALVGGATTWAGSIATVGMAGAAGSWSAAGAPATWSGSIATVGTAGQTSVFVPGARTWVSSTAASGVTGVSGAFTSLYTWIGSNASLGGAGQSGDFVPGARTWASTFATVGAAGITGSFVPGPRTWAGSVATVGITALTRPFVPGAVVWVGSIATIGVAGESRVMSSGISAWWNGQEIVDMMWESTQVLDWVKT